MALQQFFLSIYMKMEDKSTDGKEKEVERWLWLVGNTTNKTIIF